MDRAKLAKLAALLSWVLVIAVLPVAGSWARVVGPGAKDSSAAQQQAPVTIEFLNPRPGDTVSDKVGPLHLVAWSSSVPTGARVEFAVQGPVGNENPIALDNTAVLNSWETFWDVPDNTPGQNYSLRVYLFDSTNAVLAMDEATVTVGDPQEVVNPAFEPEGVEIVQPSNANILGAFTKSGQAGFTVTVRTSNFSSTGIRGYVRLFYTTSAPGSVPVWTHCTTQAVPASLQMTIPCNLGAVDPLTVTGVRAVANATPQTVAANPANDESPDAHRVQTYTQTPSSVLITPSTTSQGQVDGSYPCVSFTITARDQFGNPIWRAPVDAHATGPTDGLRFGSISGTTSSFKEPNDGGHSVENALNCGNGSDLGLQGDHNVPGGPDTKHIEDTGGGTSPSGSVVWAVRSDSPGSTSLVGWVDATEDDVISGEPQGTVSITWLSGPQPSPTASPSPTPTASPSPSPTASPSPSPTASPTASPSPTPTGGQFARSVTLEASDPIKTFRRRFSLSGTITSEAGAPAACTGQVLVKILRDVAGGAQNFQQVTTTTSDFNGTWSVDIQADVSANYIVQLDETPQCADATSSARSVLVRKLVQLGRSPKRINPGQRVNFEIAVFPCDGHAGDIVKLQKARSGRFVTVAQKATNSSCEASFSRRISNDGVFRGRAPKSDEDHEKGTSRQKFVDVRGR